jgi:phage tail-like protein
MALGVDTQLGLANRFVLTLIAAGAPDFGSWQKAEGLDVSWEVAEYRAGDAGNDRWYLPGNTKYSQIKLSRATCQDSKLVQKWLDATSFDHKTGQAATLSLRDSTGTGVVLEWNFDHIMPVKWSVGGFDAGASKVQVETLEFAHMGFLKDQTEFGQL